MNAFQNLYKVIKERKANPQEGSYTCYLFEKGLDKILKKCAEECGETIIAAKNQSKEDLENEICDLFYHIMVLMAEKEINLTQIESILDERGKKIGNLKPMRETNKNT